MDETYTNKPVTLNVLHELLLRLLDRQARIETRLVRLMLDAGLDENGYVRE
jgi:hypothetical protein